MGANSAYKDLKEKIMRTKAALGDGDGKQNLKSKEGRGKKRRKMM